MLPQYVQSDPDEAADHSGRYAPEPDNPSIPAHPQLPVSGLLLRFGWAGLV